MTPAEVDRLLERWAPTWQRRVVGPEREAWRRHLERHAEADVSAVLDDLIADGNRHPLLADVLGKLNAIEPQRPAPYKPSDDWQGPTDRGRELLAKAKAEVAGAFRWEEYRHRRSEVEL